MRAVEIDPPLERLIAKILYHYDHAGLEYMRLDKREIGLLAEALQGLECSQEPSADQKPAAGENGPSGENRPSGRL